MFDGRHCTEKDLKLLTEETEKIRQIIKEKNDYSQDIESYLDLVVRFDVDTANKIKRIVSLNNSDTEKIIYFLNKYIDELIQNIIVDINEHQ